jgi:hypothetical protein
MYDISYICDVYLLSLGCQLFIVIYQIIRGTKGHMAVYGPGCHFASVHIIFCG